MSLESFYGGKQGLSSIIKKAFKYISVDDPAYMAQVNAGTTPPKEEVMELCLQDTNFKEVWYGELCLINTVNKNNPANGCLFRRTLAKQGSVYPVEIYSTIQRTIMGNVTARLSAEYVGQIVGPQSSTPFVNIGNLQLVNEKADVDIEATNQRVFEYDVDEDNSPDLIYDKKLSTYGDSVYLHDGLADGFFVRGRDTDDVRYGWCNIRDNVAEGNTESWTYLGFQVPLLDIDWTIDQVNYYDPYYIHDNATDNNRIFYQDWQINIPRGVRGNAASRIRRTTLADTPDVYLDFSEVIKQRLDDENKITSDYYINTSATKLTSELIADLYDGAALDNDFNGADVPFFVYDYTIYNSADAADENDKQEDGVGITVSIFMGFNHEIAFFSLSNDGLITAHYDDKTHVDVNQSMPWIDTITINSPLADSDPGLMTIEYNNRDRVDGKEDFTFNLGLVYGGTYDESAGQITLNLTDGESFEIGGDPFEYPVSFTVTGDIADDGSNEADDRRLIYTTNLNNSTSVGDPINYIQDIVITEDKHLCILFNDINHRTPVGEFEAGDMNSSGTADENGILWRENILGTKTINGNRINYGDGVYWRDYGSTVKYHDKLYVGYALQLVKDEENGGYNYDLNGSIIHITNSQEVIDYILNQQWPDGLAKNADAGNNEEIDMRGMLVTAVLENTALEIDITYFYAYDYNSHEWVLVQESTTANSTDIVIGDEDLNYEMRLSGEGIIASTITDPDPSMVITLPLPWLPQGSGINIPDLVWDEALNSLQGEDMINDIWGA